SEIYAASMIFHCLQQELHPRPRSEAWRALASAPASELRGSSRSTARAHGRTTFTWVVRATKTKKWAYDDKGSVPWCHKGSRALKKCRSLRICGMPNKDAVWDRK